MKTYKVYFGNSVPFDTEEFNTWKETSKFIKQCLDSDIPVHSVCFY